MTIFPVILNIEFTVDGEFSLRYIIPLLVLIKGSVKILLMFTPLKSRLSIYKKDMPKNDELLYLIKPLPGSESVVVVENWNSTPPSSPIKPWIPCWP
jgi:hypothetical protein